MIRETLAFARRSLIGRLRQPESLAPSFVFPLFFAALGVSSFGKAATRLPGFPADSYLAFSAAGAVIQGVLFGATAAASDLATDIEGGFWERMVASPVTRSSIVVGRLASSFVVGAVQAAVFLAVFMAFGVRVHGGIGGFVGVVVGGGLIGLAVAGLFAGFAIRSGSSEAVQGAFPLVFVLLFLSSAFFPRQYMSGWYRHVADVNPTSHVVEGLRQFVTRPLGTQQFATAWGIPAGVAVVSIGFALRSLHRRLAAP